MLEALMLALGIAYLAYAVIVERRFRNLSPFSALYIALGLLCIAAAIALFCGFTLVGSILAAINIALFLAIFAMLAFVALSTKQGAIPETVEWIVVLGCLLRGDRPGSILADRLDLAAGLARKYLDARIVVCGGQGPNELVSEAEAMYRYLVDCGIRPERIAREESSTSTTENLQNFQQISGREHEGIIIVTSDFHVPRTARIAKECGLGNTAYSYCKTPAWKWINCALREAMAMLLLKAGIGRHNILIAGKRL